MLTKEFADASKKWLECIFILPLSYVFDRLFLHQGWMFSEFYKPLILIIVAFYSAYSGSTVFQAERKHRAFEYLFSWPMSRLQILIFKLFPRLLFLLIMISIAALLSVFENGLIDGFHLILIFFISVFISIAVSSLFLNLVGIALLFYIFQISSMILNMFVLKLDQYFTPIEQFAFCQLLPAGILLIPLGLAFWLIFKHMDIKPLKHQLKPLVWIVSPAILSLIIFVSLFFNRYVNFMITNGY